MNRTPISEGFRVRSLAGQRREAVVSAGVVLVIPLVLVPLSALFADLSTEATGQLPLWAVEAFRPDLLLAWIAAARLPWPIAFGYGLIPLAMPPVLAIAGLGTVGRWAILGGFCLIGSVLTGFMGLGMLLELIAPSAPGAGVRLEVLAGLCWPLLAVEGAGCLLAASIGASEVSLQGDGGPA